MKRIVILGVGGYCANLIDMMRDIETATGEKLEPLGFLDDDPRKIGTVYHGHPVMDRIATASTRYPDAWFVNGIGSAENAWRKDAIIGQAGVAVERFVTLVHPSAYVAPSARVGRGTVVAQNCVIMAGATVGDHVKMLPGATISYGGTVGHYSTVSSGAVTLSDVKVGRSCYIGANVTIKEFVTVGDDCVLGMGTVVLRNVPDNCVMVGNPARLLRPTKPASSGGAQTS
jgi:sugar O-acyltransferase (sialic acid O-acetyltransferase NeuD family)